MSAHKLCKTFDLGLAQQTLGPDLDAIGFDTCGIPELFGKNDFGKQLNR